MDNSNEDGCDGCQLEEGWACVGEPSLCLPLDAGIPVDGLEINEIVQDVEEEVSTYILSHPDVSSATIDATGDSFNVIFTFNEGTSEEDINIAFDDVQNKIEDEVVSDCLARANYGEDECNSLVVLYAVQAGAKRSHVYDVLYTVHSDPYAGASSLACGLALTVSALMLLRI
jgi:hypothetical protein